MIRRICLLLSVPLLSVHAMAQGEVLLPGLKSLKITGEYRLRAQGFYNYDLNEKKSDDNDFFAQRVRLRFDALVTDDISATIQIQDVRLWGEEKSTIEDSADGLDLHRAFVQFGNTCMGGSVKIGRQVLAFGDQRLVGHLEWLEQGRAFDGYRHTWKTEDDGQIDLFLTNIRERMPTAVYNDQYFGGLYTALAPNEDSELDLYVLLLVDEETAAGGTEKRASIGLRYQQSFGGLQLGTEIVGQIGQQDGADFSIADTHAVHLHAQWTADAESKPWARVEANYATGNDPSTADNERFKVLFPTAHAHLGMMDIALWENVLHGMLQIGMKPCEKSKVALAYHAFNSVEETDRFVGPVAKISPMGGPAGESGWMGQSVEVFYNKNFDTKPAKTYLQFGYGIFLPGSGAQARAGEDNPAHFFYLMSGLTF